MSVSELGFAGCMNGGVTMATCAKMLNFHKKLSEYSQVGYQNNCCSLRNTFLFFLNLLYLRKVELSEAKF